MCGEHDFYVKITPRRKSGNAVARTSVAPVQLHRLIRHKGINTRRIIACGVGSGGGSYYIIGILAGLAQLSQDTLILGFFFGSTGRPPRKYFLKATARPQIRLWRKVTRNKKLVVGFIIVTPSCVLWIYVPSEGSHSLPLRG
jgi:hypothetical protein